MSFLSPVMAASLMVVTVTTSLCLLVLFESTLTVSGKQNKCIANVITVRHGNVLAIDRNYGYIMVFDVYLK